jgi:predicted  nucleic acid-binding Zn-ribbon protein
MNESTKLNELKAQLEAELAGWQTKIDEARVQLDLGSKEAGDKLKPYIKQLENEMGEAKEKWAQLEEASEHSWKDIKSGLDLSMDAMKEAFSSAKKHFSSDKTS